MNMFGWLQFFIYMIVLLALVKPLGSYMSRVYQGKRTFFSPILLPLERFIYRVARINPKQEMDWKVYTIAVLLFNLVGLLFLYLLLRLQGLLPLNPSSLGAVSPDQAFNSV
jgi:K+-transporting ATPase ATPase A chain